MHGVFYGPFCSWLVNKIPEWIAPNLITLTGFLFSTAPFVLFFVFFGTHLYNEEPATPKIQRWMFFAEGLCYFAYRILDELDGKQARRTGNSSPLGLLFDHGCDAFAVGLQCLIMAKLTQMGLSGFLWVHSCNAVFHFCTLEEYYVGGLFLPPGNAISDGSFIYYLVMVVLTIFGNEFMALDGIPKDYFYKGSPQFVIIHCILVVVLLVTTVTIIRSMVCVVRHKRKFAHAAG